MNMRLQKYIADCGLTSRRKAEILMRERRVKLNGQVVTRLGTKLDLMNDVLAVDDQVIHRQSVSHLYVVLNKPRSVITTLHDPEGRKTVIDLIPEIKDRIYPVGRLDYHSEGLLILTNDGEMAHRIMHPSFNVLKVYEVKVFGAVTTKILQALKGNHHFSDGVVRPQSVRVIKQLPEKTWLEFRLWEGKNREIRRICDAIGLTIDKLRRVSIGNLSIQGIGKGEFHIFSKREIEKQITQKFVSQKRTVDIRVKGIQGSRRADDPFYLRYRSINY